MEILPLPSSNEPITNVVRYLSQPPVIVQKAMAGQARGPGPGGTGQKGLGGAPQRAARLPDDWGVRLHLKIILKGIDFSSCWSAIRHLKPPGPQISCRIPAYARRGGWEGIQQKVLDIQRDIRPMHGTARNADHA